MSARRALWRLLVAAPHRTDGTRICLTEIESKCWREEVQNPSALALLRGDGWLDDFQPAWVIDARLLEAHALLQPFLTAASLDEGLHADNEKTKADLAFMVFRNVKGAHRVANHPSVYTMFRGLSQGLRDLLAADEGAKTAWWSPAVQETLQRSCDRSRSGFRESVPHEAREYVDLFFEVCLSLEELDRGRCGQALQIRPEWLDADFLLSRLYGMRTGLPGFDILFGGGLSLADPLANPISPARIILIRGPFGAGKSILGMSLAAEVKRKGGDATVVSLDATLDSLIGYVGAFDLAPEMPVIVAGPEPSNRSDGDGLTEAAIGTGLLLIRPPDAARLNWEGLLKRIGDHLHDTEISETAARSQSLKLLVIDPVNSVLSVPKQPAVVRRQLMATLERARQDFGNIVLVAEGGSTSTSGVKATSAAWTDVLAYVADVVIDLGSETSHGYERHFIQVSKSRFQRERRGRHPVSIVPGRGISVSPSSAAYRSEFLPHGPSPSFRSLDDCRPIGDLGFADFEQLLWDKPVDRAGPSAVTPRGANALQRDATAPRTTSEDRAGPPLCCGDTIVLRGPQGSFKTLLGIHFLLGDRSKEAGSSLEPHSLFLTDRTDMPFRSYIDAHRLGEPMPSEDLVRLVPLSSGFTYPGQLLREIQAHFTEARDRGWCYDRVLVATVGRWDLQCPFIRDDPVFGSALMDLFRAERATAVFVCDEKHFEAESALQRVVVDRGTVVVDFQRVDFNGAQRTMMRVARARTTPQTRYWVELRLEGGRLHIDPSLLRVQETGIGLPPTVEPIETILHFYQVGEDHKEYHEALRARLHNMLMTPVKVSPIDRVVLGQAPQLGPLSVGSHLRLVQLDEFQLPALTALPDGRTLLHPFPAESVHVTWDSDRELQRAICHVERGLAERKPPVVAFPYYRNLGLLTVKREELERCATTATPGDWLLLAEASMRHRTTGGGSALFFDCAKRPEDYNCLFLEIVLSLSLDLPAEDPRSSPDANSQALQEWIGRKAFANALEAFHKLCAPAHRSSPWTMEHYLGPAPWESIVSRQWCTSLRYWLEESRKADMPRRGLRRRNGERPPRGWAKDIEIVPLPGEVAVSGDWFIGVWSHSAVPDIGYRIIETLTSPGAQLERMRRGIGLPVSSHLLGSEAGQFLPNVRAPAVNLQRLAAGAKRRSSLYNYDTFREILSQQLIEFLVSAQPREGPTDAAVQRVVDRLRADIGRVSSRPPAPQGEPCCLGRQRVS